MRAQNRKSKPKFATKTKINKFFGITFYYLIMKPKVKQHSIISNKKKKFFNKKVIWAEHGGWF